MSVSSSSSPRPQEAPPSAGRHAALAVGLLAAQGAALIGSAWQITSRHGVTTSLGPAELAVLRYAVPALVLMPLWCRPGWLPRGISRGRIFLLVVGGGLPFGLVAMAGVQWAPAAHMGIFMAGSVPLFVAVGERMIQGGGLGRSRTLGLLLMAAGIAVLGMGAWRSGLATWRGDLLFMLAALLWSAYTLALRGSGLTAWQAAAMVNLWSCALLVPMVFVLGAPRLLSAPWTDLAVQALGQGVVAGVLGLVTYTVAIARLGAARGALSAVLVPLFTALGAAWWLGEPVDRRTWLALALVVPGMVLASGALAAWLTPKQGS